MRNIKYLASDNLAEIIINRPEKKNSLTSEMYGDLKECFDRASDDSKIRLVILKGQGEVFTAGNDINDFVSIPEGVDCRETNVIKFIQTVSDFQKPIIANVNGLAIGIGVTILMHCDFVYSTKDTKFLLPFVNLGLCPEAASSILIPLNSNMLIAKEKLLLGEPFGSAEALNMGIVSKIYDTEKEMVEITSETAAKICNLPSSSISFTKKLINQTFKEMIKNRILMEGQKLFELLHSDEAKAAFSKFLKN